MINFFEKNINYFKVAIIVFALLISFPRLLMPFSNGLDMSWVFAINKIYQSDIVWGKDVVFTYGPLGFLIYCQPIGNNLLYTSIFWAFLLISHSYLLYQLFFKSNLTNFFGILVSFFLFTLVANVSREYYICYVAFLAFLLFLNGFRKNIYIFGIILILSFFIKFSLFIMIFSSLCIYLIFGYFYSKNIYKYSIPRIIAFLLLVPIAYFVICGFYFDGFIQYVRGSIDMSSGYIYAMSIPDNNKFAFWIIIASFSFLIATLLVIRSSMYNLIVMLLIATSLFMCFKRGFVRADGHASECMNAMLYYLSLIPLFINWKTLDLKLIVVVKNAFLSLISITILIAVVQNELSNINFVSRIKSNIYYLPISISNIKSQVGENKSYIPNINPLPDNILKTIGNASVTIYPIEISYWSSNPINYVPLFGLQAYSIYTPYLDQKTAEKLQQDNGPKFIIFNLDAIDSRWALIECPRTWEVIRNYYEIVSQWNGQFLLKRKNEPTKLDYNKPYTVANYSLRNSHINLKNADFVKIYAKYNLRGKLAKLFWKLPEVNMNVVYSDGSQVSRRVLLDMFSDGVELGFLPKDPNSFVDIMQNKVNLPRVRSIYFSGSGVKYYDDNIEVKFFNIMGINVPQIDKDQFLNKNYSDYSIDDNANYSWCLDEKNYKFKNTNEVLDSIYIKGWFYKNNQDTNNVVLKVLLKDSITKQWYTLDTKTQPREDVTKFFNDGHNYDNSGFIANIPSEFISNIEDHNFEIYILYRQNDLESLVNLNQFLNR